MIKPILLVLISTVFLVGSAQGQECPAPAQFGNEVLGTTAGELFGQSVAVSSSNTRMVVGSPSDDTIGQDQGAVRIYTYVGGNWEQLGGTIYGTEAGAAFGHDVKISDDGSVIAVAAPGENFSTGAVRAYVFSGGDWMLRGTAIIGAFPGDEFSSSIGLSGDGNRLAVGAPLSAGSGSGFIRGTVSVFGFDGIDWTPVGGAIFGEANYDLSGSAIDLSNDGSSMAIASSLNDGAGADAGHVRVFRFNGSSWVLKGLEINGDLPGDLSGSSVSLNADGNVLAIGSPGNDPNGLTDAGHVRVFQYNGSFWSQQGSTIEGSTLGELSGTAVGLNGSGTSLIIGAPFEAGSGNGPGQVRAYQLLNGDWVQSGAAIAGSAADDQFGVALDFGSENGLFAIGFPEGSGTGGVRVLDASCDAGCTNSNACNYDPDADIDDGSCDFFSCITLGCTDATACNFDPAAEFENGSCTYALDGFNCDGSCIDTDNDGTCDVDEVLGCQDNTACNFNQQATENDGSCVFPTLPCDVCSGEMDGTGYVINLDTDGNGICVDIPGCMDQMACNYNAAATEDDGSCAFPSAPCAVCSGETDGTGVVLILDTDGDGVCDSDEVLGCTDPLASNYDPNATEEDASCLYLEPLPGNWNFTPSPSSALLLGQVTLDGLPAQQGDWIAAFTSGGICAGAQELIIFDSAAYVSLPVYGDDSTTPATTEGMSPGETFTLHYFDASEGNEWVWTNPFGQTNLTGWTNTNGAPLPGYSDPGFVYQFLTDPALAQCNDPAACNYTVESTTDVNCTYAATGFDCAGNCILDLDDDGVCDSVEIFGCTDPTACNFDPFATEDDGSCAALDACGVCGGPGAIYSCGCFDVPEGDCDCFGNQPDAIGECGGTCLADLDEDGVCDDVDPCIGAYDACGVCNGPGAQYACGCDPLPDGDCDCEGNQLDAAGVCGGDCTADVDGDGICDDVDDCLGVVDECGVCNGPGAIYACGCFEIGEVYCDCDGNQLDALGVCGGDCPADIDGDGICDDEDPCIGFVDACGICNGPGAIYACGCDPLPAGACDCAGNIPDAAGTCGGDCQSDVDGDGVCDTEEVLGCDDVNACNWQPFATDNDGSCLYPAPYLDCAGNCLIDTDGDGICEQDEINGCTDSAACNYNPAATDDGDCFFPPANFDCAGNCLEDTDGDGVCDALELPGCTDPEALNFNPYATEPSPDSCIYGTGSTCASDLDGNGAIGTNDLLLLLGAFGSTCE